MIPRRYGEERRGGGGGGEAEVGAEIGGRGGMKRRRDAVEEQRRDHARGGNCKIGYVTTTDLHIETLWVLD